VFLFAALVTALDQIFKQWVTQTIHWESTPGFAAEAMEVIPGVLNVTHARNPGIAMGMLSDVDMNLQWPLAGVMLVACLILVFVLRRYDEGFWGRLGLAAVLGGAAGNLIDRVFRGGLVVDMFEFPFAFFPYIFNIADVFIVLGGITFCIHFIFAGAKPKEKPVAPTAVKSAYDDLYGIPDVDTQDTIVRTPQTDIQDTIIRQPIAPIEPSQPAPAWPQTTSNPAPGVAPSAEEKLSEASDDAADNYLKELGIEIEDYDLDKLLGEYGLETDKD